jgi:tetratricopeptide (TPR) repeat protein
MKKSSVFRLIFMFMGFGNIQMNIPTVFAQNYDYKKGLAATDACSSIETWSNGKPLSRTEKAPRWIAAYQDFIIGKISLMSAMGEAIQLKRISQLLPDGGSYELDFSEYWIGRIFYEMKLDFLAVDVMKSVIENSSTAPVINAAWVCLGEIAKRTPDLKAPESRKIPKLASENDFKSAVAHALSRRHEKAIQSLEAFFARTSSGDLAYIAKHQDDARLILARSYYAKKKWAEAISNFQKVSKTSNRAIEAMSDLSWAYLQSNRINEALGLMMQLRIGSLRNTFAPEPLMVAAIAYNELCHYPDSIRMIHAFINDYAQSFQWLKKNRSYDEAYAEILRSFKKQSTTPPKIISEWIKSPIFIVRQTEINELIDQPKRIDLFSNKSQAEREQLTKDFIDNSKQFVKELKVAKLRLKPGQDLNPDWGSRHRELKKKIRELSRFFRAQKIWKNISKNYVSRIPKIRTSLVNKINKELKVRNAALLVRLEEIRENSNLIEIEIYQGASRDMIWKNANPDFDPKKVDVEVKDDDKPKTWTWGRYSASEMETAEIWEDELGAVQTDLTDRCKQKEKYQNVKMQGGS